ncbi:MAG: hypothetical protein M5U35_16255 [Roseovarius sp.]|nr:hypothetical protein [Roseovarius sp.]
MPALACDVIVKIVTLFLVFMVVLAMFGRLRFPGQKRLDAARCPRCGRFRLGRSRCACGTNNGGDKGG